MGNQLLPRRAAGPSEESIRFCSPRNVILPSVLHNGSEIAFYQSNVYKKYMAKMMSSVIDMTVDSYPSYLAFFF